MNLTLRSLAIVGAVVIHALATMAGAQGSSRIIVPMPDPLTLAEWSAAGRVLALSDAQTTRWDALYQAATMDVEHLHREARADLDELSEAINAERGEAYMTPRSAEMYAEMVERRIELAETMDARYRDAIFLMSDLLSESQLERIDLAYHEARRRLVFGSIPTNHPWLGRDPVDWLETWRDEATLDDETVERLSAVMRSESVAALLADLAREAVRFDREHLRGGARASAHLAETTAEAASIEDVVEREAYSVMRYEAYAEISRSLMEDQWRLARSCDRGVASRCREPRAGRGLGRIGLPGLAPAADILRDRGLRGGLGLDPAPR